MKYKLKGLSYFKLIYSYLLGSTCLSYPPFCLLMEPTNFCNLKCVMCPQNGKMTRSKGYMDFELFRKIIDEAKDFVDEIQLFQSGESLLHPRFFEMISYAHKHGIYLLLNTNATLLNEEKTKALLESGLDYLSFSFDAPSKEKYEALRQNANYDLTMKNILYFVAERNRRNLKKPYTVIEIIEMKETSQEIKNFIAQFKNFGVDEIRTPHFHNWGNETIGKGYFAKNKNNFYYCEFPYKIMSIQWDGTVVPCGLDYNSKYVLGDVKKNTLMEIWNGPQMREFRGKLAEKKHSEIELCKDCSFLVTQKSYYSLFGKLFAKVARIKGIIK